MAAWRQTNFFRGAERAPGKECRRVLSVNVSRTGVILESARPSYGGYAGALGGFLTGFAQRVKIIVWAHNSHLGDARVTEMGEGGEINVGQLVRERYKPDAALIGFSTYQGTVTAASDWGAPAERQRVRPALADSYEALFHDAGRGRFFINLRDKRVEVLRKPRRLERAIGVVYRPQSERLSHYFYADLPAQFDAVLHFDATRAVHPLERAAGWDAEQEVPETFPSGILNG